MTLEQQILLSQAIQGDSNSYLNFRRMLINGEVTSQEFVKYMAEQQSLRKATPRLLHDLSVCILKIEMYSQWSETIIQLLKQCVAQKTQESKSDNFSAYVALFKLNRESYQQTLKNLSHLIDRYLYLSVPKIEKDDKKQIREKLEKDPWLYRAIAEILPEKLPLKCSRYVGKAEELDSNIYLDDLNLTAVRDLSFAQSPGRLFPLAPSAAVESPRKQYTFVIGHNVKNASPDKLPAHVLCKIN